MLRHAIFAHVISFVVIASISSWIFGGAGIFYAAGFFMIYGIGAGIAAVIDPKTFSKDPPAER